MSNNEIREKRKKVICDLVKDDFYVPMKEKELAMFLQVAKDRSTLCAAVWHGEICGGKKEVVGDDGLEPPTSSV